MDFKSVVHRSFFNWMLDAAADLENLTWGEKGGARGLGRVALQAGIFKYVKIPHI